MGVLIALDYFEMEKASGAAKKAAGYCEDYAYEIERKVTRKLDDLKKGSSYQTSQAGYFAKQKIRELKAKGNSFISYSEKVDDVLRYARERDETVSGYIKRESDRFRQNHDMKVSKIEEFFVWATTTLVNRSVLSRILSYIAKTVENWIDMGIRKFRQWYHLAGGKYIIKAVLYAVVTVCAVAFLAAVAWPALLQAIAAAHIWTMITAVAGFATAVFAVVNSATKYLSNFKAFLTTKDDPGWARRQSGMKSLADYLRRTRYDSGFMNRLSGTMANILDTVKAAAEMINIADMARRGFTLLGGLKNGKGYGFCRKMKFSVNGKMSKGTIGYGLKSLKVNLKEFKDMVKATNISRIEKFIENPLKKTDKAYTTMKDIKKYGPEVFDWVDKGPKKYIKDKIKDQFKMIEDIGNLISNYKKGYAYGY